MRQGALPGSAVTIDMPIDTFPPVEVPMANASSNGITTLPRASHSRAQSMSSDRPSTIGVHSLMSPPLSVSPEAAFIAGSAASQIVTNDHDTHSETWYDQVGIEPSGETALVSNGALRLVNSFIDQLLFNVLATAKSTTLSSLRSAVIDVLKPKLAKDAINSADEELREYLGGGEIEDLARSVPHESSKDWDLELVWKRTRLRCMVYSSLGDMEEEDEDFYMEQEHLSGETDDTLTEIVSPAVAIFLTSILEFTGEQVLVVAGQAAFNRLRTKYEKELKEGSRLPGDLSERIVVEDLDMERVALDRTFGRLWRAWKKRIRSPLEPNFSRPFSRSSASVSSIFHQRPESITADLPAVPSSQELDTSTENQSSQRNDSPDEANIESIKREGDIADPSMLPLPDSDVEVTYSDEDESEEEDEFDPRPKSWVASSHRLSFGDLFTSQVLIKRARSLPSRKKPRYSAVSNRQDDLDNVQGQSAIKQAADSHGMETEAEADVKVEAEAEAEPNGLIEGATPGAATVGATAVAGSAAIATGIAPHPKIEEGNEDIKEDEVDSEIEEFVEEPEILTSSRISIGGRSSPATSEPTRPASIINTRSNSVRSVRVIEVQGPRSRPNSVGADPISPTARSISISREGSISRTPPIVEENDPYSAPFVTDTGSPASDAVSSYTEDIRDISATLAPPPRRNRSPPKLVPSPVASHTSAPTKVAVLDNAAGLSPEERQDGFQWSSSGMRNPPMPTLLEKSANRPVYVQSTSAHRASPESPKLPRPVQSESPSSARFKHVRTSEDSSSNRPMDVARNFEELIQSDETLQYTLTPENMRDIDVSRLLRLAGSDLTVRQSPSSQPNGSPKPNRTGDTKNGERSRSSSIKRSISVNKSTGLSSHPPTDMAVNGKYGNAVSKAPPPVSMRNRIGSAPQAREARVPRESMQDFADFIRSTGPPGESGTRTNKVLTGSSNTVRSVTGAPPLAKSSSMEVRRPPRLQARDAVVNTSNESSELIDFIRRGPPKTKSNSPRIPRNVAPFRNTQDSDYMTSAVGGKAVDAIIPNFRTSQASTNVTESSAPSSMNSQSALLNKSNKPQLYSGNSFDDDDMMPKRTQRRVRDPYAIDPSDEEYDDYDMTPKPKVKQEESLIDFLNNYPPPAEPSTQPIVLPKKKSSAPNLIARLRYGSSAVLNGSGHSRRGSGMPESRSLSSRAGSRAHHTPIVVPPVADKYTTDYPPPVLPRATSYGRAPMKKFEPRDASFSGSQTADLANFLRDSQPPSSSITTLPSPAEDKTSSGFSRMFERRKKSTAY
ncbi:hypothetical protein F5Y19DRAFT_252556 [Xylariaceae sp. FL1651]|nr:hypothetical protein F5Y19DRAFT_252556 [Xylariaceae sp. FL1651]